MADSSFDIVSKIDRQEVDNALGQTAREVATRFDFKGTGATIEWKGDQAIEITASADDRASAVLDVFQQKLIKRGQSLKILDASEPRPSGQQSKIGITLKEGITSEDAKKISKLIRDEGPKGVKAQIQGDELRISSKKRDDLQAVQALVKAQDYEFAVQFTNYRSQVARRLPAAPGDHDRPGARQTSGWFGGPRGPGVTGSVLACPCPSWPGRPFTPRSLSRTFATLVGFCGFAVDRLLAEAEDRSCRP